MKARQMDYELEVTPEGDNLWHLWQIMHDFILIYYAANNNFRSIFNRFRDVAGFLHRESLF